MRAPIHAAIVVSLAITLTACGDNPASGDSADSTASDTSLAPSAMAIGDDRSAWANDGECDDPRFVGSGMAADLLTDNIGQDASDCQAALDAGTISPNPLFDTPASNSEIVYGDDAGEFPNDGECDDIRFTGDYASGLIYLVEHIGHDATDCRNAVESGAARWQGNTANPEHGQRVL